MEAWNRLEQAGNRRARSSLAAHFPHQWSESMAFLSDWLTRQGSLFDAAVNGGWDALNAAAVLGGYAHTPAALQAAPRCLEMRWL
jgi:hypothetical protein